MASALGGIIAPLRLEGIKSYAAKTARRNRRTRRPALTKPEAPRKMILVSASVGSQ